MQKQLIMQLRRLTCIAILCTKTYCIPTALPATTPGKHDLALSAIPDLPDREFTYDVTYIKPPLTPTACVMACIAAMHELALLDWNTYISTERTWTHPNSPKASLILDNVGGSRCTVRFALWLIQAAIRHMMIQHRYQTSAFLGRYRKVLIGRVQFVRNPVYGVEGSETSADPGIGGEKNGSSLSFKLKVPSAPGPAILNNRLGASVEYLPKRMDIRDTYFIIIWLIMAFGSHGYQPLRIFQCNFVSITVEARTIWNSALRPASREGLLSAADMVNFVAQLAVVVHRDNKYREMNVLVYDGGVEVARGAIRTSPLPRGMPVPLTANVTVA